MESSGSHPLIAVDIGNSRIKFGWYEAVVADTILAPSRTLALKVDTWDPQQLFAWLQPLREERPSSSSWAIATVSRKVSMALVEWVHQNLKAAQVRELSANDLSLNIVLPSPDRVGIDRLLAAVAVNHLRDVSRPAIVVDMGSAITVDLVSDSGAFSGGAILPGISTSARVLVEQTDFLPHVPLDGIANPPPAIGTTTDSAIRSGLFWGSIGAIRELVARQSASLPTKPQLFLTGGDASPDIARLVSDEVCYEPHLVLGGIAWAHATKP